MIVNTDPLVVNAVALNSSAINITWEVPMSLRNQDFDSVLVNVQPESLLMSIQTFIINSNETTGVVAGSLGKFSLMSTYSYSHYSVLVLPVFMGRVKSSPPQMAGQRDLRWG